MTVQGMFQPSGDQYDPQKQSDAEGDQKRQMETADRRHGFVIQSQQEKEIRYADSWKDKRCRSDKSCKNKQKKTGISGGGSCLEEIRGKQSEESNSRKTQDNISQDPPGQSAGAGFPDDKGNASCHSADKKVEHGHIVPFDQLKERICKKQYSQYAAHGKDKEKDQILLFVFHKRTYGRYQTVIDSENHGHGAAAYSRYQHGRSDDETFQSSQNMIVFLGIIHMILYSFYYCFMNARPGRSGQTDRTLTAIIQEPGRGFQPGFYSFSRKLTFHVSVLMGFYFTINTDMTEDL